MKIQIATIAIALVLMVDYSSAFGLLGGLGFYGNPMLASAGCGCGCVPPVYGYGTGLGLPKTPAMGLGCPSPCYLGLSKPCLLTKLFLLKKKLMEKKMNLMGCGCGYPGTSLCGCGMM